MGQDTERVVLITGCSSGIGRVTAQYLAEHGWYVFACARRLGDIGDLGGERLFRLALDVTDEDARIQALEQIVKETGRLDALVNNAGVNIGGPLELVSLEDAHNQFETNLWGALRLAQLTVPLLRKQGGGRIVNVSSIMARLPLPYSGLYCASKAALESVSQIMRWELAPWNISVSIVEPGSFQSNVGIKAKAYRLRFAEDPLYGRFLAPARKPPSAMLPAGPLSPVIRAAKSSLFGKHPIGAARVVERALNDKSPRFRYEAGLDTHVFLFLRKLIPDWLYDRGLEQFYGFKAPAGDNSTTPDKIPRRA